MWWDLGEKSLLMGEVQEFQLALKMEAPWINKNCYARFVLNIINPYEYEYRRGRCWLTPSLGAKVECTEPRLGELAISANTNPLARC
jgi:hypothetical protein